MTSSAAPPASAALPRRDRLVIALGLVLVTALAWAATLYEALYSPRMAMAMDMFTPMPWQPWSALDFALIFAMWVAMMAAMMVPASAPMVAAFAAINRRRRERRAPYVATGVFLAGYLLAWATFSALATAAQWRLEAAGLLTAMMATASPVLGAFLFLLAGAYQWSPLKQMCLVRCRSPQAFVLTEWRDGTLGALVMGLRHGLFCIGCCAALMALLFAVAVMDLRWVAALTLLVTIEKLLPHPAFWRRAIGAALLATAAALAARVFL